MTNKSGVVAMVAYVAAYLTAVGVTAHVSLGWRERTKQINQGPGGANRVVFTPSDDSGRGGEIVATQQPGQRKSSDGTSRRALFDWDRYLVVSVWGVDGTSPEDESLQIEATETLFERVMQGVQNFAGQGAHWGSVTWTNSPLERAFGKELRAALIFRHPMFDAENQTVVPGFVLNRDRD